MLSGENKTAINKRQRKFNTKRFKYKIASSNRFSYQTSSIKTY